MEKQSYPWKLKAEELSPTLKAVSSEITPVMPMKNTWLWAGGSLAGLGLAVGLLWWQSAWIQIEHKVAIPEQALEKTSSLQILPAPNRYALWAQAALPRSEAGASTIPATSFTPSPSEFPEPSLNNTDPPAIAINLPPTTPEEPSFNLIGIAQGADGIVATVKVKDGDTEEIKDVRQGAPLLPGYTVTQIEEEYLLLKVSKGGQTIRVD